MRVLNELNSTKKTKAINFVTGISPELYEHFDDVKDLVAKSRDYIRYTQFWDLAFPFMVFKNAYLGTKWTNGANAFIITALDDLASNITKEFFIAEPPVDFALTHPANSHRAEIYVDKSEPALQLLIRFCILEEKRNNKSVAENLVAKLLQDTNFAVYEAIDSIMDGADKVVIVSYAPGSLIFYTTSSKEKVEACLNPESNIRIMEVGTDDSIDWYLKTFK